MSATVLPWKGYLFALRSDGSTAAIFAEPRECKLCHAMHCFFVNRFGSTCCVNCDHKRLGDSAADLPAESAQSVDGLSK